ncbi:MAG: RNA polymerase sigma-70 factor [Cytophagales bacterium CG18_big_fil_WC_8_21_14_2_50_42_9]|nr:MAG: RNA polymerase sigma-70 factor [Cytophagales bacterium CG18_big_fil_WC_8_21_14_2_50_42_9]
MKLELEIDTAQKGLANPELLQGGLTATPVQPEATVIDVEVFIKQTFQADPRQGCELLFRHYYQPLCSHAVRLLYSKALAEDLVSEIFLQFYQKGTYQQITSSYRAYLYKAVRNSAYNYLRWEANRSADLDSCADFSDLVCQQPDAIVQYEELYQQVEAAINALPTQRRKVYLMHRFEDKKYNEIATELQLSPRTVEVQIRKASHFLKEVLRSKWIFLFIGCFSGVI